MIRHALLLILLPALAAISCGVNEPDAKPPIAKFAVGCVAIADSLVEFTNQSVEATRYQWDLGNGESSTDRSPKTRYTNAGEYQVRLVAENANGVRDTIEKTITIFPPALENKTLPIPFLAEGSRNWTWAAISEMILRHMGTNTTQCEILDEYFRTNCCERPGDCVVPGTLRQIELDLERIANLQSEHQFSPLTLEQIKLEIAQNRPVVAGYERVGVVHAVMIVGYDEFGNVTIHDPPTGSYTIPYTEALRYGSGSNYLEWTESTYCIRK